MNEQEKKKLWIKFIINQLIGSFIFLGGIICCYQGVLHNLPWFGPLVVLMIAIIKLSIIEKAKAELKLILIVITIAFILETISISSGIYTPDTKTRFLLPNPLCPLWILALWANFALKIKDYLFFMKGKPILNFVVGFIFGILIFHSVASMQLGTLNYGKLSILLGGLSWAIIVPILFKLAEKLLPPVTIKTN